MQWVSPNRRNRNAIAAALIIAISFLFVVSYLNARRSNQDYVAQAEVYERLYRWNSAIERYTRALESNPDDLDLLQRRARSYMHYANEQAALVDLNKALALLYLDRGRVHHNMGQFEQAVADFSAAIDLTSTARVDALNDRGLSYAHLGDFQQAIADFDAAIALEPDQWVSYNRRGDVYAQLGQDDLAFADFQAALSQAPDEAAIYLNLGDFYYERSDFDAARQNYYRHFELTGVRAEKRARIRAVGLQTATPAP